ncbi:MAG: elongation factor P [Candidatus Solibacter usitatus]|nr:elongation factor P [Candidatus Solibacter usitatus]
MMLASQLRTGMAVRHEGQSYKVISAEYHPGQGKMGGVSHVRLKNLDTGTQWETSLRADLKLEELPLEKKPMAFLYVDEGFCFFMDPDTCEQAEVALEQIGDAAKFLLPEMRVSVEFLGEKPVSVQMPGIIEVRVEDTAPPMHGQTDSNWKPALLENRAEVMVPQFIKNGDSIRLDLTTLKYMDRVKAGAR